MSIRMMSEVWRCDLKPAHQALLLALTDHAADDGSSVYPSREYLAWKTGASVRSVSRHLEEFRKLGILIVIRQGGGRGNSTEYKISLAGIPRKPPFRSAEDSQK